MPVKQHLKKVLVVGSGPIVIGQAAEFDYAGTQACRALREEGLNVVLVNSNPATIMTDGAIADEVYVEPLTLPSLREIIRREKPDGRRGDRAGSPFYRRGTGRQRPGPVRRPRHAHRCGRKR